MFKLDKSTVLKYYCLATILCLNLYKIINHGHFKSSNIFINLSISLNLIFVGCYLFKENVVLNGSENLKTFFVACTSEYFLIWDLVKLLGKSQDLTIYITNYAYFGLILLHLGLYKRFPEVFEKFLKFNCVFTIIHLMIDFLLQDYNFIRILVSSAFSIIVNYCLDLTLDSMTISCTNYIYLTTLLEAITFLISSIPKKYDYIIKAIAGFCFISILYIYLSTYMKQFKDLENRVDDDNLEGEKSSEVV